MARTYQTVNWQDGTIVTPAKVTVAGTEYEVTPAVKTGQTPINATNLRKMDNEIKRIVEEDLPATEDVKLIDVADTAPVEFEEGDKYYNTEDNKVYTAVESGGITDWDDGETPIEGILYIVFTTQSSYAYDGTSLISVGGGSGGGSTEIAIDTTEPQEEEVLWINPDESVNVYGSYISNQYGTSQAIGYSQEFINGDILYDNVDGTNSTVTLSSSSANYRYMEIYFKRGTMYKNAKIYTPSGKSVLLDMVDFNENQIQIATKVITISGTSITVTRKKYYTINDSATWTPYGSNTDTIYITRVVGYK